MLKLKGLKIMWMFDDYAWNCRNGYQGKNKYQGNGTVGITKDGKSWRRATAKRRKKRK